MDQHKSQCSWNLYWNSLRYCFGMNIKLQQWLVSSFEYWNNRQGYYLVENEWVSFCTLPCGDLHTFGIHLVTWAGNLARLNIKKLLRPPLPGMSSHERQLLYKKNRRRIMMSYSICNTLSQIYPNWNWNSKLNTKHLQWWLFQSLYQIHYRSWHQ